MAQEPVQFLRYIQILEDKDHNPLSLIVGYDYPKQEFYITNKNTTTYRGNISYIETILSTVFNIDTDSYMPQIEECKIKIETLGTDKPSLFYTWSADGSYIYSIQFNEWKDYPLILEAPKARLRINDTVVIDLTSNESIEFVVAPTLCRYYLDTLGLSITNEQMASICNFLIYFYKPTCINLIAEPEQETDPLKYSNQFKLTNYNNTSVAEYIVTNNPYNEYNYTKVANIISLSNSNQITISDLQLIEDKYTIQQGTKLQIAGISEEVEGEEYSANGEYTVQNIEDNLITVEETFPMDYEYPFYNCYVVLADYSIVSMSRDNSTITLSDNPNNILVGDKIIVVGANYISELETIILDKEYTVQAIQEDIKEVDKGYTISDLIQNTNNTISFTTSKATGTIKDNKLSLNYTVTYETNEGTEEDPNIIEHSETYEHEYIVNSIEGTTVTVIGTLEGLNVPNPVITGNTITYKEIIITYNITVEEEIATNFSGSGAYVYKNKLISPIKRVSDETNSVYFLNSTEYNLVNNSIMCYNSNIQNIDKTKYKVTSMLEENGKYIGVTTETTVNIDMEEYPQLQYPIPSTDMLVEVTKVNEEFKSILPTGKFILNSYSEADAYIGLCSNLIKPTDMNKSYEDGGNLYQRNVEEKMYNVVKGNIEIPIVTLGTENYTITAFCMGRMAETLS